MDTKFSINHKLIRMFANILSIFAILAIAVPATGGASAQGLTPWFTVFPEQGVVEGWDWPLDAVIHMTIDDPGTEVSPDFVRDGTMVLTPWDPDSGATWLWIVFSDVYSTKPGDIVTLTDGVTSRTHAVRNLSITAADPDENTVAGIADGGQSVILWSWEGGWLETTADESGNWSADFDDVGFDLVPGYHVRAEVWDDGNDTAVDWYIPNPHFTVFPEWEWFDGLDWPDGSMVTITVDNKPECQTTGESWGGFFNGGFPEGCDIVTGDFVTFTGGETIRMHTVQNLVITAVDKEANTISGTADVGALVYAWVHEYGYDMELLVEDGTWLADFGSAGLDLMENMGGRTEIRDELGNATAVDWYIPNPHFTIFPEWEWFDGWDWPNGAEVNITVADKPECETTKESWGYFFNGNFGEGCDVEIDDMVTFTDGETTRTHTVQNLVITKVNQEDNIVKGIADPGAEVYVWPHATGQEQVVTTNPNGNWNVDFTGIYDLVVGDGGRAEIRDEIGNATAVDWNVSNPRLIAFPAVDQIFGYYWPEGTIVNLKINDKHIAKTTVQGAPWDPNDIMALFDFGGLHDLVAGDLVTLSGHDMEINYTVQNLTVTDVDETADTVSGTSDPYETVYVWQHEPGEQIPVEANEYGEWFADLSGYYDIRPGSSGRSEIRDEVGNATAVDWYVPNPHFTVFPSWEWYDAMDWDTGTTVTVTVGGESECNFEKESPGNFFNGGFPAGCDIEAGDTVTFTDGATSRTHVVRNLAITAIDLNEDTISGIADAGATVYVWPHNGWFEPLEAVADAFGVWQVNLGDAGYDIQEGASGRSEIRDEMGNATAVDWSLNPRIIVHTTDDWFRAEGFMPNTSLDFWIYDAPGGNLLHGASTGQTDSGGTITHWVGDQQQIVPGNHVIVSDGTSTRDIVLEALTFDVFDTSLGILQGMAPEPFGRTVSFGIGCWQHDDLTGEVTTDESGVWTVNFGAPVPNDFGCVFAWIYDEEGDSSEARPEQIILWSD